MRVKMVENVIYYTKDLLAGLAYWIVNNITKKNRIDFLESILALHPGYGFMYCRDYLPGRFVRGEELILRTGYDFIYKRLEINRRLPDIEQKRFREAELLFELNNKYLNNKKHHILSIKDHVYKKLLDLKINIIVVKDENNISVNDILFLYNPLFTLKDEYEDVFIEDFLVFSVTYCSKVNIEPGYVLVELTGIYNANY